MLNADFSMPWCSKLRKTEDNSPQNILLESPNSIAKLLRLAAHPARIQIMALLLQGEHEFSRLMQQTKLSKTALANHLNQLVNKELVEKTSRGEYNLTTDGKELLKAVATMYENSVQRQEAKRQLLSRRYTEGLKEVKTLERKVISKKVEYQPCWISYFGAVAGCLKALGTDCDMVDVGGHSGYAFLINVAKGVTCPSGPTAFPEKTWKQIRDATEELGWTIETLAYEGSYPEKEGVPTSKEIEKAQKIFDKIKQEIDERDRPVVLWGLVVPEYGIVKGYEGNSYIVSTFRRLTGQPENPILFYDLKAPGCLDTLFFRKKVKRRDETVDKGALQRAINFASAKVPILSNYEAGPTALDEWANVLETLPEEKQNYHGNSYVGACYCESREVCAQFLKRLAKKHPGKQSKHLVKAAECYERGWKLMTEFTQLFPFKFQGDMSLTDRKKGAELLRKVKPNEEEAIQHMKNALEEWAS
jgi:DNA-binding HxlR family transcriptional regulator